MTNPVLVVVRDVKMGQARQPVKKRAGQVEIFSPSTHCSPARLTCQFSEPKRASPSWPINPLFYFFMFKTKNN